MEEEKTREVKLQEKNHKVLETAILAGQLLLSSGAEIARVQDTIQRILTACEIENSDIYVVANGIFITLEVKGEKYCTALRHVPVGGTDLGRIVRVNQVSREICSHSCTIEEGKKKLDACRQSEKETKPIMIVAAGIGCAGFSYLFGPALRDCLCAFVLGCILQIFLMYSEKIHLSKFLSDIFGSALVSILGQIMITLGIGVNLSSCIIGAIMLLVPGFAFTTGIRDLFGGDYLSGSIHLLYAIMTAVCIAIGVGAAIMCMQYFGINIQGGLITG